jgi:3-deoxy-alpha-D-manno-octulosonate 8-oxidase
MSTLDTNIKTVRNVSCYSIGSGSVGDLKSILDKKRNKGKDSWVVFFIDVFFVSHDQLLKILNVKESDEVIFIDSSEEPTTTYINKLIESLSQNKTHLPEAIVGMGGGTTMDIAKAISNLFTNSGKAEDYQGWDLVKLPGVFKIAIPTLSGTGAEATRTCVMTNKHTGLKLGMNSDFTVYDHIIMDPDLTLTVSPNQYFYTGMDAYIHCIESLNGEYRNAIGDAYSNQTVSLVRKVFNSDEMMSDENRSKMMVASYLGGCAIATSYVGVVHPFSAGLSVVLGIHHCVANCITMRAMQDFYPKECDEFWGMVSKQKIDIPTGVCCNLTDSEYNQLYDSTIIHEKPLTNALGKNFRSILTKDRVVEIFKRM